MKKILSLILALTMILSLAACGASGDAEENDAPAGEEEIVDDETVTDGETEEGEVEEEPAVDDQPAADPNAPVENEPATPEVPADPQPEQQPEQEAPAASGDTVAAQLQKAFEGMANASALDIATALSTHEVIKFGAGAMPVEPGLLSGFDNYEVTGFQEGAVFMPMIGSIAFVGYIFTLEDGADVNAFMENLKANCNPRWNICVAAEETRVASVGNKVFFVMSPLTLEG
ncbi:MAG: hypothetical protein IKC24_10490 [Oscillospiraceae bacterium]|nr:hypothetical protein [Oscillospiraceae bacterium]